LILIKPPPSQTYPKVFGYDAMASASEAITSGVAELSLTFPDRQRLKYKIASDPQFHRDDEIMTAEPNAVVEAVPSLFLSPAL
jgi:hypothetical protein